MTRAAIYTRISKDSTGEAAGVRRQEQDCRALAAERGWEIAEVFKDNDVSAYRRKPRPGWRKLLAAVEHGDVQAVVAWHPDRMYRRAADLEELVNFVESHKLRIATVTAGDVDLSTPTGRMQARIVGAVAQKESEQTGDRIRRALRERREAGKPAIGGIRPYGFDKVEGRDGKLTLVPVAAEAAVLKEAATKILRGESWGSVAKDLNRRGVRTVTGKRWSPYLVREMLVKPQAFGLQPDGREGQWPAILEPRVRKLLERRVGNGRGLTYENLPDDDAARDKEKARQRALHAAKAAREGRRRYLLTGLLACAECGSKMIGASGYYRCSIVRKGCGKTAVQAHTLESEVFAKVNPLDEKRWRSRRPRRDRDTERVLDEMEKLEARLDGLAGNVNLSERTLAVRERAIQQELAKLRDQLPAADEEPPAPDPARTQELLQAWATGELDQRGTDLLAGFLARTVRAVKIRPGRGNVPARTKVTLQRTGVRPAGRK